MKVKDITAAIERFAPLGWQAEYDNAGLAVGDPEAEISSVLVCVDVTEEVLDEAVALGAGLVVSHHPVLFRPLRELTGATYIQRCVMRAVREGIALYSSHTNLDSAPGGLSHVLGARLDLRNMQVLDPSAQDPTVGFGVVGDLERPVGLHEFLSDMKRRLHLDVIRCSRPAITSVRRVALCTGAGASLMKRARMAGADLYIAADFKYNDFLDADRHMAVADIGHFESEWCAIGLLAAIIEKNFANFAVHKSVQGTNPVEYIA